MRALGLIGLLIVSACSLGNGADGTTTVVTLGSLATITEPTTTTAPVTTVAALETCEAPASTPTIMPERVVPEMPDPGTIEFDDFTRIAGTYAAIRFDETGSPVLLMIRGALPPRQFTSDTETVSVLGDIPALVGPIGDGYWAAAWAIPPGDRCDLYSLIFYPPVEPETALGVTESLR